VSGRCRSLVTVGLLALVAGACRGSCRAETADRSAVVSCRASIARYRTAERDGASPDVRRGRAQDVRRDCAGTIRDGACRGALTAEYEDHDAAMKRVASACRDAYCPRLPPPKPPLCATWGEPGSAGPTRSATFALLAAVRAYELDTPPAELADIPPPNLPPPVMRARDNDAGNGL
jgi:hypothetical protein